MDAEPRVEQMYCFVVTAANGDESVPVVRRDDGWWPLVGALAGKDLRADAQRVADHTGMTLKLLKFSQRQEVEEVAPRSS